MVVCVLLCVECMVRCFMGVVLILDEKDVRMLVLLLLVVCLHLKVLLLVIDIVWGRNNLTLMCCPNTIQWQWRLCVGDLHWTYGTNGDVLVPLGRKVCTFVWLVVRLNLKVLVFDLFDAVLYEIVISHSCVRFSKTLQWKWPPWGWSSLNVWNGRSGQTASMFARDVFEFEDFRPYYIGVQRSFGA